MTEDEVIEELKIAAQAVMDLSDALATISGSILNLLEAHEESQEGGEEP